MSGFLVVRRQDFSPSLARAQDPVGEDSQKPLPAPRLRLFLFAVRASKLSLSLTKKPPTDVSGFCSRGGRIRTCDLLVPNQAP